MLRVSRTNLARAWIALKDLSTNPGGFQGAWDRVRTNAANDSDHRILREAEEIDGNLEIEELFRSLVLAKDTYDDGRVIDDLLEVVNRAYTRSRIDSRALELIKAAIMTPGDHAKLSAALEKDEGHCAYCGHTFIENEVAVYKVEHVPADRRGFTAVSQANWYCTRCVHPEFHACSVSECNSQVPLNQKARAVLTNTNLRCPTHQAEAIGQFKRTGLGQVNVTDANDAIPFDLGQEQQIPPPPQPFRPMAGRLRPRPGGTVTATPQAGNMPTAAWDRRPLGGG